MTLLPLRMLYLIQAAKAMCSLGVRPFFEVFRATLVFPFRSFSFVSDVLFLYYERGSSV